MNVEPASQNEPTMLQPANTRRGWIRALWAGMLSFLQPGLGQVYAGVWGIGIVFLCVNFLLIALLLIAMRIFWPSLTTVMLTLITVISTILLRIGTAVAAIHRIRRVGAEHRRRWFRSTWIAALLSTTASWLLSSHSAGIKPGWRSFTISSPSGLPTLQPGDHVVAKLASADEPLQRGVVAMFSLPGRDPLLVYVGRIVGLPGDHVQMIKGVLYLNGAQVPRERVADSQYEENGKIHLSPQYIETLPGSRSHRIAQSLEEGPLDNTPVFVVPANSFFYLGDNRSNVADSRLAGQGGRGFIPMDRIVGFPALIVWGSGPGRIATSVE